MSNYVLDLALANQEQCFVKMETTAGTLKKLAAADRVYSVGPVEFSQEQELIEDGQIRASASKLASITGRTPPGDWNLTTYVKPSGTAGVAPEHDVLFACLMGTKDPQGGYVDYKLDNQLDSFSLWSKKSHTVFGMRGCTVETATFTIEGGAIASIKWAGKFMELLYAGEATVPGALTGTDTVIQLQSGGAQRFRKGMFIVVGTLDNSDAGYEITAINYANDQLTISPGLEDDALAGALITPLWITSAAEVGYPQHGKLGIVTVNGANAVVTSADITIANNIKYYEDEKNGVLTAERYGRPQMRAIGGSLKMFFVKAGPSYFYRAKYRATDELIIPVGEVSGKIMEIHIPYAEYRASKLTGDAEIIHEVPFEAIASAALNDEAFIRFK